MSPVLFPNMEQSLSSAIFESRKDHLWDCFHSMENNISGATSRVRKDLSPPTLLKIGRTCLQCHFRDTERSFSSNISKAPKIIWPVRFLRMNGYLQCYFQTWKDHSLVQFLNHGKINLWDCFQSMENNISSATSEGWKDLSSAEFPKLGRKCLQCHFRDTERSISGAIYKTRKTICPVRLLKYGRICLQ